MPTGSNDHALVMVPGSAQVADGALPHAFDAVEDEFPFAEGAQGGEESDGGSGISAE